MPGVLISARASWTLVVSGNPMNRFIHCASSERKIAVYTAQRIFFLLSNRSNTWFFLLHYFPSCRFFFFFFQYKKKPWKIKVHMNLFFFFFYDYKCSNMYIESYFVEADIFTYWKNVYTIIIKIKSINLSLHIRNNSYEISRTHKKLLETIWDWPFLQIYNEPTANHL